MRNLFLLVVIILYPFFEVNSQSLASQQAAAPESKEAAPAKAAMADGLDAIKPIKKENGKVILPPEKLNPMRIPKFSAAPVIDGKLDDALWEQAAIFRDFIQTGPGDNIEPSKATIVYMAYDEKNLYMAFRCFDEKDKIRATIAKRDQVFGEDNVRVWLDTYDDRRRAYVLGFNPLGIQADGIFTEGQGGDFSVDIVMESKGIIEEWGWSVEVKVPFKSLRYVAGKGKNWGFNAARNIDRFNDEFDTWMPDDRNVPGFLIKHGKITGLDEIKTERTFEIIPTFTLKETGRRVSATKFVNPPIEPDFGFTAKYSITPNITLDAAYNPDFADTEADAPVVEANQRFPIFFQEKRPFFLEGVDIFNTPIQAVYTRNVENPDVAAKLSGKTGKNSFGIFAALDDPLSGNGFRDSKTVGVVRLKRDFGKESTIGFLATYNNFSKDREELDENGRIIRNGGRISYDSYNSKNIVAGFDTRWKINQYSEFRAQVLGSRSRNLFYDPNTNGSDLRNRDGVSHNFEFNYDRKNYGFGFGGNGTTKDFRADVGFTRRTNSLNNYVYGNLRSDPKPKEFIIRKFFNTSFGYRTDYQGRQQSWGMDANINMSLKGNTEMGFGGYFGKEKIYEDEFGPRRNATQNGAFFGNPEREAFQGGNFFFIFKNFHKRFSADLNINTNYNSFDFDFGGGPNFARVSPAALQFGQGARQDPGPGFQFDFNTGMNYKPTDKLNLSVGFNKSFLRRNDTKLLVYESNILSFRSGYQFSRFVSLRARMDYSTINNRFFGQYTFGWTPSPGKALYIGYNDNWSYKGVRFDPQRENLLQLNRTFFIKLSYLFRKSF